MVYGRSRKEEELSRKRREGYLSAISRADLTASVIENGRICSDHFLSGKPAGLFDETSPNWLPTEKLGHSKISRKRVNACEERYERKKARSERLEAAQTTCISNSTAADEADSNNDDNCAEGSSGCGSQDEQHMPIVELEESQLGISSEVQTELTSQQVTLTQQELNSAYEKISLLEARIAKFEPFTEASFRNDKHVQFYTGLPSLELLQTVFDFVLKESSSLQAHVLSPFQEFVAALIKLRLNPPLQDLAYRFQVSLSTMSCIVLKWVTIMDIRLRPLILWPDRQELRQTMPECFRASFSEKVAVIIDCFEVFIERPSNLLARACTWSSYKHHNTVKLLIGITPQGVVSFISQAWGGRVSDKYLTEHCGILSKLLPGDILLADRGFDIADSVGMQQAKLHLPAFTRGKEQLTAVEVEETRSIANVRIHVERVIGCVRQKYTILQETLPINYVCTRSGQECPLIDRIARVCCALCNLCDSVVPFN